MCRRYIMLFIIVLFVFVQGCSPNNSIEPTGSAATGVMSVSLTDAPAFGYEHVWVTVRDLWFHTNDGAEPGQAGWIKFPLASPVTIDLLTLGSGNISPAVWDNIEVPEGDYTQMRIFLVRTDAPLVDSAQDEGLTYNNEVDVTGEETAYPLRVPDADRGIRLTGEFTVKKNEKLNLAVDFDAGHDVIKIEHDGKTEYILKPRLAYFDLHNAGAIVGSIDPAAAGNNRHAQFVIKAEQIGPNGLVHLVRRVTTLADVDGKFILFPLLPGDYDIVIRGVNYETVIIKGVPVVKGTTPESDATVIPAVIMTPAVTPDYLVNASITSPTGAWVDFLQTLPGAGEVPYQIRFKHFNPLTGNFSGFLLSSGPLQTGTYDTSGITLTSVAPVEGSGGYKAVAGAPLHHHSEFSLLTSSTNTLAFDSLNVALPATERAVSGSIIVPQTFTPGFLDRGVLFAIHGGMIVNAIKIDGQLVSGGTYSISNLPGGTPEHPLSGAFYGIEAFGWSSADPQNRAIAVPQGVDLRISDATGIDVDMALLP